MVSGWGWVPRLIEKDVETELCQIQKRFKSALRLKGNRSKEEIEKNNYQGKCTAEKD